MNFKKVSLNYWNAGRQRFHALLERRTETASFGFVIALPLIILSCFAFVQVWPSHDSQSSIDNGMSGAVRQLEARVLSVASSISPNFNSAERLAMDSLEKWTLDNSNFTTRNNLGDSKDISIK